LYFEFLHPHIIANNPIPKLSIDVKELKPDS
jgi:hypothetical protein